MITLDWIVANNDYSNAEQTAAAAAYSKLFGRANELGISFGFVNLHDISLRLTPAPSLVYRGRELLHSTGCILLSNFSTNAATERAFSTVKEFVARSPAVLLNRTFPDCDEVVAHKLVMALELGRIGASFIPSVYVPSWYTFEQILEIWHANQIGLPAILKPARLGRGQGIVKIGSSAELASYWAVLRSSGLEFVLQPYIEHDADVRVYVVGNEIVAKQFRIPEDGNFRANVSLGARSLSRELPDFIADRSLDVAARWGADYLCIDWLCSSQQPVITEVCSTLGGFTGLDPENASRMADRFLRYVRTRVEAQNA